MNRIEDTKYRRLQVTLVLPEYLDQFHQFRRAGTKKVKKYKINISHTTKYLCVLWNSTLLTTVFGVNRFVLLFIKLESKAV